MVPHSGLHELLRRITRRDVLRVSVGAGLSFLLPTLESRAAERRGAERPKSLITLWMAGGQSQLESWDPHPQSSQNGSEVKAIETTVSGLQIADTLPQMAEQMHHLSVIRSMVSKEGDHERGTYYGLTGYRPDPSVKHPSVTAVAAKFLPARELEIPSHIVMAGGDGFTNPRGGYLGAEFDAFRVPDPGNGLVNLQAPVEDSRQSRRLEAIAHLSDRFRQHRRFQSEATLHNKVTDQALEMMSSEQLKAFSLEDEPTAVRERYGTSNFGRGCLVARRLVETGVRAVQVTLPGFDTHANNNEGQRRQMEILDPAFASLMMDLHDRDLLDSTIVLCMGEFGRTPWLNPLQGRDHWPVGFSCVLGGGGIAAGRIIGETNSEFAAEDRERRVTDHQPPVDPVSLPDLYATILHVLGLDPADEVYTPIGRPIKLAEGTPLDSLLRA